MYAVSDAFLTAVAANTRGYYWAGTVTTTTGKLCPGIIGWNADSGDESQWKAFQASL